MMGTMMLMMMMVVARTKKVLRKATAWLMRIPTREMKLAG